MKRVLKERNLGLYREDRQGKNPNDLLVNESVKGEWHPVLSWDTQEQSDLRD